MSIFKRLFRDKEDPNNISLPTFKPQNANIKAIGSNLQKRFSRGVQYNMKVLIRGDRNVGKSALLNRLKGQEFVEQYIPTEEIEVACIHWSYKGTEDVIKVEVWDVVDKGRKKIVSGLKLENNSITEDNHMPLCLDAEFLDVYKGAHGVILVLDMTKSWTYTYVERELNKLSEDLPVLVLANHRDMGHHRTVTSDQVLTMLEPLSGYKKGLIKYWESSMKNGYGLVYIHKFFNIPFLMLQRDTLLKQLVTNEGEMKTTQEDLEEFAESVDCEYENFIKSLKISKTPSEKPSSLTLHSTPSSQINSPSSPSSQIHHKGPMTPVTDTISIRPPIHPPQARPIPGMERLGLYPLPVPSDDNVIPSEYESKESIVTTAVFIPSSKIKANTTEKKIFDFVPDEHPELSIFLEDSTAPRTPNTPANVKIESSSEEDNVTRAVDNHKGRQSNPMVTMVHDDIDVEDISHISPLDNGLLSKHYELSSSDDEQKDVLKSKTSTSENLTRSSINSGLVLNNVSSTNTVLEEPSIPAYTEIIFDATDLDILDQMSSKKEIDTDEITLNSSGSMKQKKKKKHHKHSETKDSSSKRKKKSLKHLEEDSSRDNNSLNVHKQPKKVASENVKSINTANVSQIVNGDSSDSLEKFLNEL